MEKIFNARRSLETLCEVQSDLYTIGRVQTAITKAKAAKHATIVKTADDLRINLALDSLETIECDYHLAVGTILAAYYRSPDNESQKTKDYYRVISSANFVSKINSVCARAQNMCGQVGALITDRTISRDDAKSVSDRLFLAQKLADVGITIDISVQLEKKNFEVCKCGARMHVIPEVSELQCPDKACGRSRTIIGAVFRDDQFYPQEGQTTKHSDYDTGRHYKFWIERLQAIENKQIGEEETSKIEYILARDGYDRRSLTCEQMREVLKDSMVEGGSRLNEHVPLLVKTFGGPTPPCLTSHEDRLLSIRFNKAMRLYDIVNPSTGNKPYYPYFIFKLVEWEFRDNPEKLRLLDYIHLQSRETVIKNDINYEKMAALAGPNDGIVYTPTDPVGRL